MKILVLSDSHGQLSFARQIVQAENPDRILHLGDVKADAVSLQTEYPTIPIFSVPGNCDGASGEECVGIMHIEDICVYYTHGHLHAVKWGLFRLLLAAQEAHAQIAAFGHTHEPHCEYTNGVWLINPGSCQREGRYAVIEWENSAPRCSLRSL